MRALVWQQMAEEARDLAEHHSALAIASRWKLAQTYGTDTPEAEQNHLDGLVKLHDLKSRQNEQLAELCDAIAIEAQEEEAA